MKTFEFDVTEAGARIDKYLSDVTEYSRSRIQALCADGFVSVNGDVVKGSYKIQENDRIVLCVPPVQESTMQAENIPLDILYEDEDIIVINKPKGMVVHPAPGAYTGTLVNALLYHCKDLSGINGELRPGIVHRIDKDTTGCIVACKNDFAHEAIARQIQNKTCRREYDAIVVGNPPHDDGLIDAPIGRDPRDRQKMTVTDKNSRDAQTVFKVTQRFKGAAMVHCTLKTGRTHQIRVHMRFIGHPVMGDLKYGSRCRLMETNGQALHASSLTLVHPRTGETMLFNAPLPEYFSRLAELLSERGYE